MVQFTVEEENLICMYHKSDRRRTAGNIRAALPDNKDVLDEFIARTEETLSDSNAGKQLAKVEKDIAALDVKRAKLVDMRLEENIDKDTYEQKYFDLSNQIEQLQKQREGLQESAETENTMKKRIAEFRKTLEENEVLDTFDRYVFESIVEKSSSEGMMKMVAKTRPC